MNTIEQSLEERLFNNALSYIDETCPQAWFRPMFAENTEPATKEVRA
jgi:hypothetical protein